MADNVESLYMNGALVITATGSSMRNSIFGNGKNNVLYGMGGNDVLSAKTGNDTLIGGLGDDRLDGGFGSDTYRFARGDGADTLTDLNYMADNADVLEFLAGIANDQLWLQHIGNDLVVGVIGTADQVTVSNWYQRDDAYKIEKIQAGGKTLNSGMVENLVNAMAVFAPPASGQTTLPASYQSALNGVIAANWQ